MFTLQQRSKIPGLVSRFLQGNQVLNFTGEHQTLDPLLWLSHPSLKIVKCRAYLEARLSGSMRNSNLIHSVFFISGSSTSPSSSPWKQKELRGASNTKNEAKQRNISISDSWPLFRLILLNRSVITVLYAEMTIAIYDNHLF
jgi:hypothetical protein